MDQVAVLTAAAGVPEADATAVAKALGGQPKRLSDRAVEIAFSGRPDRPDPTGIDLNILPAENRAKRLLIADMDSTIIAVECIDELADYAGKKDAVAAITERAMAGELDFEAALRERVALLTGVTMDDVVACYDSRVRLNDGATALIATMNARGAVTALVSGGFTVFTDRIRDRLGFAFARANTLVFEGDRLTGSVGNPIVSGSTKLDTLNALMAEHGIDQRHTLAVGDGANDGAMVQAAGLGVAYRAKPTLRKVADATLDHSDLTALLSLQGIPGAEFQ